MLKDSSFAKWRQLKALGLLSSQRDTFTIFFGVGWWLAENHWHFFQYGIW